MGISKVSDGEAKVGAVRFGASNVVNRRAVVPLTSANILGMFGTPVTILAAPGAGKALVVRKILLAFTAGTQYASGGVVTFQYSGGAAVHAASIPASVITSAASSNTELNANTQANG